eukprot:1820755-Prymnesium_polylepis.1
MLPDVFRVVIYGGVIDSNHNGMPIYLCTMLPVQQVAARSHNGDAGRARDQSSNPVHVPAGQHMVQRRNRSGRNRSARVSHSHSRRQLQCHALRSYAASLVSVYAGRARTGRGAALHTTRAAAP